MMCIQRSTTRSSSPTRLLIAAGGIVLLLASVGADVAQGQELKARPNLVREGGKGQPKEWWTDDAVKARLNLSPEQSTAIGELQEKYQTEITEIIGDERQGYRTLIQTLDRESATEEEIAQKQADLVAAWSRRAEAFTEYAAGLREILSLEQWKELPSAAPASLRLGHLSVYGRGRVQLGAGGDGEGSTGQE